MNKKAFLVVISSFLLLVSILTAFITVVNIAHAEEKGPRSDIKIVFYPNQSEAYAALKNGSADFVNEFLNFSDFEDALNDPNLVVSREMDLGTFEFDINNNYSLSISPGIKSPTHEVKFRQAIAFATDKDYIMNQLVKEQGARIDQQVNAACTSWMNETYLDDGYPYKYNLTEAAQLLDELGFIDTDQNGWRNYPSDWPGAPGADFTQYPLQVYVRNDRMSLYNKRLYAGRHLVSQLESLGIKCNKTETTLQGVTTPVFYDRNYHIYTAGWTNMGYYPSWGLYNLYHSTFWSEMRNYVTGMNESNLPNYPQLDKFLEDAYYAESLDDSRTACKNALGFLVEKCITVPLYTPMKFLAYRKEVHNVLNPRIGTSGISGELDVLNRYTLLNAYKDNGEPLRIAYVGTPDSLNILSSFTSYQGTILFRMHDTLTYFDQYDTSIVEPWVTSSRTVTTWNDVEAGETKTKIVYYLRDDNCWIKPVTGENLGQVNASDCEFGVWYTYQRGALGWNPYDIHHVKVVDDYTFEVYMDYFSISFDYTMYSMSFPVLPKTVWTSYDQLTKLNTTRFVEGVNATTPGYLGLPLQDVDAPAAVNLVKADDTELVEYIDYQLEKGQVKIMSDLLDGTNISITYWARGNPDGFYPGDLAWEDILVGNGAFYPTEINIAIGGYVYLKANPDYFVPRTNYHRDIAISNIVPSKTSLPYGETLNVDVELENQGNLTENFRVTLYANTTSLGTRYMHSLLPEAFQNLTFKWNTTNFELGTYKLKAIAETVLDESETSDNTFIDGDVTVTLPPATCVHVVPTRTKMTLGVDFSIDVKIVNVTDLYGFEIKMSYNTTLLNAIRVTEGPFLKQAGSTIVLVNETKDNEGYVRFAASLLTVENGANGNGTLFTAYFNSSLEATGSTLATLSTVKLSNSQIQPIPRQLFNGTVEVVEIDTRNFVVTKDQSEYTVLTISNSTILNLKYNATDSKISLNASGPSGYTGFCNITFPKALLDGTFAVLANGEAVYYLKLENTTHYTLCFNFTHSIVKIDIILTLEGDLDGDRQVGMSDIVTITSAYDAEPGDPQWNPMADVVKDGKIDIYDAVFVCRHYGESWNP